jgi:ATP-dependent RNA helicase DDX54/DBP10
VTEKLDFEDARNRLLSSVSGFRPKETVFEIGHKGTKGKTLAAEIMRARRGKINPKVDQPTNPQPSQQVPELDDPINNPISTFRDPEHYIAHFEPGNTTQERGYDVHRPTNSFVEDSRQVMMNLADDDGTSFAPTRPKQRWDSKKKNFVNRVNDEDGSSKQGKMIKGESGVKIPASMKSGRYLPPPLPPHSTNS